MPNPTSSDGSRGPARAGRLTVRDYDAQFAAATRDAHEITGDLEAAQGVWQPGPGRWSIAECLAHVSATGRVYVPAIEDAVRRGRAANRTAPGPFRPSLLGRWIIASMEPPPRRGMRAPARIAPASSVTLADAVREFAGVQEALRAQLGAAAGLDLQGIHVRSPLMPLLRLRLATCFGFLAAHERRHLWQARNVRTEPTFPAARTNAEGAAPKTNALQLPGMPGHAGAPAVSAADDR